MTHFPSPVFRTWPTISTRRRPLVMPVCRVVALPEPPSLAADKSHFLLLLSINKDLNVYVFLFLLVSINQYIICESGAYKCLFLLTSSQVKLTIIMNIKVIIDKFNPICVDYSLYDVCEELSASK